MKRFVNAWLALVLVGGAAGCVDLDEKLVSSLGSGYATSQQGLTDLTNGIYAGVRGYDGGDAYYGMEVLGTDTWTAADQVAAGGAQPWVYLDTYDLQYNSLGAFLNAQWQAGYTIIARANVVLDNGPSTPIGGVLTQAIKDSRLGEAHFLRAWAYFQLVQQYGDLTINLHSGQLSTEAVREPEDSVYKVIIDDLNQAINLLPATQADFGRGTLGAAQHLLGKVFLTRAYRDWNTANNQADFQQALTLANTVINSGTYSLVPIYANLWCGTHRAAAPADSGRQGFCDVTHGFSERNSEIIWPIQFSYDPAQYSNTATSYNHVVFLSQYDGGAGGWAAGITRVLDDGRPFRRVRPTPFAISLFQQTRCGAVPCGPGVDVVDTRFDGSFQPVWFANQTTSNPTGTCPKCTSGAPINGSMLPGSQVGAAAGSDTALVYLLWQGPDSFRQSKADRIGPPRPHPPHPGRAACDPAPANAPKLCAVSHKSDPAILVTAGQMTLDFIMDEREREMAGEMTRWDDLHRPGKDFFLARIRAWNPYAAPNITDKHYLRPIPQQQIQGVTGPAPYPQNPGW